MMWSNIIFVILTFSALLAGCDVLPQQPYAIATDFGVEPQEVTIGIDETLVVRNESSGTIGMDFLSAGPDQARQLPTTAHGLWESAQLHNRFDHRITPRHDTPVFELPGRYLKARFDEFNRMNVVPPFSSTVYVVVETYKDRPSKTLEEIAEARHIKYHRLIVHVK